MQSVSVNLEPSQYLAGWRPEAATLFLPTLSETRVGDKVAVRVGIYGHTIHATLFGKIAMVRRVGRPALPPGADVQLDRHSIPAARLLALAARGEPVTFKEREPRFVVERTFQVQHGGTSFAATTLNVSEGGCALRWPGQLPLVGDFVAIRMRDGLFAPTARAVVCWNHPGGSAERSAGLRIVAEGRAGRAWRELVGGVARSGAGLA